ncbi:hypothetical protein [Cryptosporangium sp. NPDC051539]|uniref:hypothetical protein n=1 Tax=Cryptosporangium sp. NPDC051539 TaxID=3363962 RepID=UPI00379AA957
MATWARLTEESRNRHTDLPRVAEVSPRELGVHAAIRGPGSQQELPGYVRRSFDEDLRSRIEDGVQRGCFVLLIGGSSTGKTRSLYEAVRAVVGHWPLVQPSDTSEVYRLLDEPEHRAVIWLDELARFFDSTPPLTKPQMARLKQAGHIVVGTLWSDDYLARKGSRAKGLAERELLGSVDPIDVPSRLEDQEYRRARELAATDSSIRAALDAHDDGLTQVLAAGPDLLSRWRHAPPYARAAITAAADARRLGILTPLSPDLLVDAMAGYLSPRDLVAPPESWLQEVVSYAASPINRTTVAALSPAASQPGILAGYRAADYLAEYLAMHRRVECPPESLWTALISHLGSADDLRRLCDAAAARMRYHLQEQALRRLAARGEHRAAIELAFLLVRRDRIDEAVSVLIDAMRPPPGTKPVETALAQVIGLRARAEPLRAADGPVTRYLADLLYDFGESLDLRLKADEGDLTAADDLASLLAERGELPELRERAGAGHRLAADLLAELLAIDERSTELADRAALGDRAATIRLQGTAEGSSDPESELRELRRALAEGEPDAAERLTSWLFEQGNEAELRAEVDAGTPLAVDRLIALLMIKGCDEEATTEEVLQLRVHGLHSDGTVARSKGLHDER